MARLCCFVRYMLSVQFLSAWGPGSGRFGVARRGERRKFVMSTGRFDLCHALQNAITACSLSASTQEPVIWQRSWCQFRGTAATLRRRFTRHLPVASAIRLLFRWEQLDRNLERYVLPRAKMFSAFVAILRKHCSILTEIILNRITKENLVYFFTLPMISASVLHKQTNAKIFFQSNNMIMVNDTRKYVVNS